MPAWLHQQAIWTIGETKTPNHSQPKNLQTNNKKPQSPTELNPTNQLFWSYLLFFIKQVATHTREYNSKMFHSVIFLKCSWEFGVPWEQGYLRPEAVCTWKQGKYFRVNILEKLGGPKKRVVQINKISILCSQAPHTDHGISWCEILGWGVLYLVFGAHTYRPQSRTPKLLNAATWNETHGSLQVFTAGWWKTANPFLLSRYLKLWMSFTPMLTHSQTFSSQNLITCNITITSIYFHIKEQKIEQPL